ncbi:MAG: hypothetical protein A2747_02030 [Candidatus Yonathbacteria bacterium RIFCSPHIGHO2_01_FULL_44_41]|uniref:DUF2269 domain-containing protein n=1 Tax=Candidatus Yonathbacteria bacterium RIFCSPHIGHO2_02_FULL_44_14 TaxID=1802724 RepID=A0A1G2S959_9BACT|nr:MAG: hypothetical protein A2747_02030 [Candidatus Yonathbacteria bacterium RIFCSPHIGHO2_01_FULL_44_41]OHA81640.1 MAG: hypothetical protein A3D51_02605 [Candidatus Yonathbacteria bacterium RIFCSPHIGHO2_02_FULL_44_14]OHA81821.1 MAG: hypothetical protein A3B06_02540 [Candidatus Yonathbacteria bacterium RIFCSPLOWO2_01_FULL_43_20]
MTAPLTYALIAHVLVGVLAIGLTHLVFMHFLRKTPSWKYLRSLAGWATIGFLGSWASGAYYYVVYYGKAVKPVILKGAYPWAHQVIMEAKEHIFIMLPFMSLALWFLILVLEKQQDDKIKKAVRNLALTILLFGAFIAGAGIIISGAARS